MSDQLLRVVNISKVFYFGRTRESFIKLLNSKPDSIRTIEAIHDFSLDIFPSEIIALIGKNGSGKSTLLQILSGIMMPSSGQLHTKGNVMPLLIPGAFMHHSLDIKSSVKYALLFSGAPNDSVDALTTSILDLLKLSPRSHIPVGSLSKGTLAMVTIAIGLSVEASVYLIDELLDCLYVEFRNIAYELLQRRIKEGSAAIIATHAEEIRNTFCSRIVNIAA